MNSARSITIGHDAVGNAIVTGDNNVVYVFYGISELPPELIAKLQGGMVRPQELPEAVPLPTLVLAIALTSEARTAWRITARRPALEDEPASRTGPTPWQVDRAFGAALDGFWKLSRRIVEKAEEIRELEAHAQRLGDALGQALSEQEQQLLIAGAAGDVAPFLIIESAHDLVLALPWELIRLDGAFAVRDGRLDVARCVPVAGEPPILARPSDTVKLLVNVSAPIGLPGLNYETESYLITRALEGQVDILVNEMGEVDDLIEGLKIPPPALGVHFSGHGGPGELVFEDEFGEENGIGVGDLLTEIRKRVGQRPRFFFLACCHGGDAPSLAGRRGSAIEQSGIAATATELHRASVTQVVGYFGPVYDQLSTWAEHAFYREIAHGRRTRDAIRVARLQMTRALADDLRHPLRDAVAFQGAGSVPYGWAQLMLYHRGPDFPLGRPREERAGTTATDTTHRRLDDAFAGARVSKVLREGFVGRRQELHGLRRSIKAGRSVHVVQGLGGLGKSAFCYEALRLYARLGWQRLALWCADVEQDAEPVQGLLRQLEQAGEAVLGDGLWGAVLAHLDQAAAQRPELQRPSLRLANLLAFILAQDAPALVLYLDNLESLQRGPENDDAEAVGRWRDDECRTLWLALQQLAKAQAGRFALLASCRYRQPDFGGDIVPFGQLPADALWRLMGWFPALRRLSVPTRAKLLQHVSGHPRSVELLDGLLADAIGHWEFDNQPLETERDRVLRSEGLGVWAERDWQEIVAPALPSLDERLSENLLFERLWQILDPPTRELLFRATVLRRPATRELMLALHAMPAQASTAFNRLRTLSLVTELEEREGETTVRRFEVHPTLARLAGGQLSENDRERLREEGHRRAGDFLEAVARASRDWQDDIEAAYHLSAVGQADRALALMVPLTDYLTGQYRFLDNLYLIGTFDQASLSPRWQAMLIKIRGDIAVGLGNLSTAIEYLLESARLREALLRQDPSSTEIQRDLSVSFSKIGDVQRAQGNLDQALDAYNQALAIARQLAARDPSNAEWQRDLSVSFSKIGDVQRAQGNLDQALDAYNQALAIREQLAARDPSNAEWQRDLSVSFSKIGEVQRAQGNLDQALDAYNQALAIARQLAARDPSNAQWQRDLSVSFSKIGEVQRAQGNLDQALDAYNQALAIARQLAARDPSNAQWQRDLSVSFSKIGDLQRAQGNLDQALDAYNQALAIREQLAARDPSNAEWQRDLAISCLRTAQAMPKDQPADAADLWRRGITIMVGLAQAGRLAPPDMALLARLLEDLGEPGEDSS